MTIASIPEILEDLKQGKMILLVDDPGRENEGDLAMAAELVTPEAVNFMASEGRGLICMPMAGKICDQLELEPQCARNTSRMGTAFTVSIEARSGVTTGISAADRARTIQVAADPSASPDDLARPGHIFPLRARDGGVLVRGGQTEGIVDLLTLAGLRPAGVICEVMKPDGTMARMPDLEEFAARHDIKICTVESVIAWRRRNERLVEPLELHVPLTTRFGRFHASLFRSTIDGHEHVALTVGMPGPGPDGPARPAKGPVHVRVHSECLIADVFGALRAGGGDLDLALDFLARQERGVLLYLRHEGHGLEAALRKFTGPSGTGGPAPEGRLPVDLREYGLGAQILRYLGVREMRLLTDNPKKIAGLAGYGLEVVDQVPLTRDPKSLEERVLQPMPRSRDRLGAQAERPRPEERIRE